MAVHALLVAARVDRALTEKLDDARVELQEAQRAEVIYLLRETSHHLLNLLC